VLLKKGIPVSPGIAIAPAFVLGREDVRIPSRTRTRDAASEVARYESAVASSAAAIRDRVEALKDKVGPDVLTILSAHASLVEDSTVRREVAKLIEEESTAFSAEYAVSRVYRAQVEKLRRAGDPYLAARAKDVEDAEKKLMQELLGQEREELANLTHPVVVVAHDLTPTETAGLALHEGMIRGFVTEVGGKTSHTAIIARDNGIPAVVGAEGLLGEVSGGDLIVLDGATGRVVVNPDPETLKASREKESVTTKRIQHTRRLVRRVPSETPDGHPVTLLANVDKLGDVSKAVGWGAAGVGLFRTEFLVTEGHEPDEEEQFEIYRTALKTLGDRPCTLRTFDFGADKVHVGGPRHVEPNPFLGFRSLRYCLANLALFKSQLRAALRASSYGTLKLMFPMVGSVAELRRARIVLEDVREELRKENVPFDEQLAVGIMIEVPSAAVIADMLAEYADFFSIGSNDLVGYTLAVDRGNELVASLYRPTHPAVLRLTREVIAVGRKHEIPVSMCGEICGDPLYTVLLLGLGLREFSLAPALLPDVKKIVRKIGMREAEEIAERVCGFNDADEAEHYLEEFMKRLAPDSF
jgi:phosphotransferase system enzyme I (PtsI)